MTTRCSECGALSTSTDSCTDRFHRFLALEMANPAYGIVHHLTVLAYMLQHPSRLSRPGWQAMYNLLSEALDRGLNPAQLRGISRKLANNPNRTWSFTKSTSLELPAGFTWTQTILNVDDSTPAAYCQDIQQWARQVLTDAVSVRIQVGS